MMKRISNRARAHYQYKRHEAEIDGCIVYVERTRDYRIKRVQEMEYISPEVYYTGGYWYSVDAEDLYPD